MVTETPPSTPNGFGVTLSTLLTGLNCRVIFTDSSFKEDVKNKGYIHAHCPYHKSKKSLFFFLLGLIPEWRGKYSNLWIFLFLRFRCDIVYSFFYSLENLKFASWIAAKKNCRHIVHIADHSSSFFNSMEFKSILESSYKLACIGNNMKDAYQERFGLQFEVFHNYADFNNFPLSPVGNCNFNSDNPLKVLFIGSLFKHLHIGAINDLCTAVTELNNEGFPIILNLYGQRVPCNFLEYEIDGRSVVHHGEVSSTQRFEIMEEHHVYIVPSSFDSKLANEYSFSIPTKLPELLASGRPTIIYGPNIMEANRFCKDNKCGILIEERSLKLLKNSLLEIMLNYRKKTNSSMHQAKKIKPCISKQSQISRFHDFIVS